MLHLPSCLSERSKHISSNSNEMLISMAERNVIYCSQGQSAVLSGNKILKPQARHLLGRRLPSSQHRE